MRIGFLTEVYAECPPFADFGSLQVPTYLGPGCVESVRVGVARCHGQKKDERVSCNACGLRAGRRSDCARPACSDSGLTSKVDTGRRHGFQHRSLECAERSDA